MKDFLVLPQVKLLVLLVVVSVVLVGCLPSLQPADQAPTQEAIQDAEITSEDLFQENIVLVATQSGQTALELLEAEAEVETADFGEAGVFVNSVNGLSGDNQHYWALYVNGEYSQTGASQTVLEPGDEVMFVYEEIDPNQL